MQIFLMYRRWFLEWTLSLEPILSEPSDMDQTALSLYQATTISRIRWRETDLDPYL